ncbi:MAG: mechanosensitive ion channel, partial [Planctomycetia bacterium]|nr:mechanosensitive ion channel [Planctomycetia bacterium]
RGLGLTVAATGLLVLALWLVARARRRCLRWLEASHARLHWLKLLDIDLRTHVFHLEAGLVGLLAWISWLGGIYVWATFVLSQFPYTHPWGDALGIYLESLVSGLAFGVIDALPGLGMVLAIFLVTRFLVRLLANLFLQIEGGHIRVDWLLPETARATRRLFVVLAWLFAVTVAYPYLPGSDSEAFKGLSVLVGLMISLGSAGVVNQVMSGFVVLYARAIRTGDYVRIGEVEGVVTELGTLSTKVVTRRKEEITIPNALVIGTSTINYSRLANADGAIVATTVTIGYDAPWRQVHALLLLAAERTPGVRKQPRPSIMQKALADFYVEYVLLFAIDRPEDRLPILSDLHAQIQDAFNEFGVQIMSPHFEKQPEKPVLSPAERWHAPPAAAPDRAPSP